MTAAKKKTGRRTFGQVRKLPSGRWQARYRVGGDGGDFINAPGTFAEADDAEAWLADEKKKRTRGRWVDPRGIGTVEEIVLEYIESRRDEPGEGRLAPRSVTSYESLLRHYVEGTELGGMPAASVTVRDVRSWWTMLGRTTTVAQAKNSYRLLAAAFGRLVEDEVLDASPVRIKKASKPLPARKRVSHEAELASILEHLEPRFHFYVKLGSYVGPRRGELRGLRRCDVTVVDSSTAFVTMSEQLHDDGTRGPLKGRPEEPVTFYVPPHLVAELVEHLETYVGPELDAYLFTGARGKPLSPRVFWDKWNEAQEAAGIPKADRLVVHDLRRTAITRADEAGISSAVSMELYGHRTKATHQGYKVATDEARRAAAVALSAGRSIEGG